MKPTCFKRQCFPVLLIALTVLLNLNTEAQDFEFVDLKLAPINPLEVNVFEYEPFKSEKLATLDTQASLQLSDPLPWINGATSLYPVYAAFAQAVFPKPQGAHDAYPPHNPQSPTRLVASTKTPQAYTDLIERKVDMIFCFAPSDSQIEDAKKRGCTFEMTPIGKDAFVFFVNNNNPVNNLTVAQLKEIYSGKLKDWKDVPDGDASLVIKAFQRDAGSGSQSALQRLMRGHQLIKPSRHLLIHGMGMILDRASVVSYDNNMSALGFSFLFYVTKMFPKEGIKLLSINGVAPSTETIRNGTYPLIENLYIITIKERPKSENTKKFINWILSEEGQTLVERTGYVPIKEVRK